MNSAQLAALAVIAPLVAAAILALVAPLRRNGSFASLLSIVAALVSMSASMALLFEQLAPGAAEVILQRQWLVANGETVARIGIQADGISVPMMCVVTSVATMVQIFSLGYLSDEPQHDLGRYYTWQSLFLFSMMGLVASPNLLQLFLCWELVGLCSYLLIGYWWRRPSAARAAVKAFWVTKFADMGLLGGLIALYVTTGSFEWSPETVAILTAPESTVATLVAGGFFFAVMGKSAQFPLHVWLPDAMEGPTPVSALLHAATMVAAGVYLVVRAWPLFEIAPDVLVVMATVGGLTAFLAGCMAIVQTDIKKVLAYSTCSQLGYMVAGLGGGSVWGAYYHLTTHAFFKALLFLAAGSVIHAVHTNEMSEMGGLRRPLWFTAPMFVIGALALAGIPPASGFVSKDLVLEGLLHGAHDEPVLYFSFLACLITVGLTAFYMTNMVLRVFGGRASRRAYRAHEGDWSMRMPMLLLAIPALFLGAGRPAFEMMVTGADRVAQLNPIALGPVGGIGLIFALSGAALAFLLRITSGGGGLVSAVSPLGDLIRLAPIDRTYEFLYRRSLDVAAGVGWFDRYVIDGLINASGAATLLLGRWAQHLQTGRVGDYVYALVGGLVLLAAWGQVLFWLVN